LNVTFFQSTNKKATANDEISTLATAKLFLEKQ
jgi:hypothetical protein